MLKRPTTLLLLLAAVTMTSCVSKKKFTALEEEKNQLEENLNNLSAKVDKLEMEKDDLTTAKNQLDSKLNEVESKLQTTETKMNEVEAKLAKSDEELGELKAGVEEAFGAAVKAAESAQTRITELENKLYLQMDDPINFRSGSATIQREDKESLKKLADLLKATPGLMLIIEGHTDGRSINTARYKDNWDLSVARSVAIVRELVKMGVNPEQLMAAGSSEYHPVADNDTAEGRKANRRGAVIVIPKIGRLYKSMDGASSTTNP